MERIVGGTTILGYFNRSKSEASMKQVMDAAAFSVGMCFEAADDEYSERYWLIQELQANATEGAALNCSYDEAAQYGTLYYGNLFYGRGAISLKELRDALGQDEFLSILSDYCKTYAYETVTMQDLLDILREKAPVDVEDIISKYIF